MANKGPDGVNRCGFLRGKKCEQKRYNEELESKAKAETKVIEAKAEAAKPDYTIPFMIFAAVVIGIVLLFIFKTSKK